MKNHCSKCEGCLNKNQSNGYKLEWKLYIISILFFLIALFVQNNIIKIILNGIVIALSGYEVILGGIKNIFHLDFEENTLMTIAVIAAFWIGEFPEAVLVLLLFRLGEFLEETTIRKSQKNIEEIVGMKVNMANLVEGEEIKPIKVENIKIGDIILVKPGEKVPLDGKVITGASSVDTSAITGESKPVTIKEGEKIFSGSINLSGALKILVEKDLKHSMVSQILDLVQEATNNKGKKEKFITRFSKIYTPIILCLAIFFSIIASITGWLEVKEAIYRSLLFLVASCPCSLVISVPLAFFAGIGSISKKGMLIKGTKHIECLAKADTIAFDKTGTLTTGKMEVEEVKCSQGYTKEEVLSYMASLEILSNHPIGAAVISEAGKNVEIKLVEKYKEIAGYGLYGKINDKEVLFGNKKLLKKYKIEETDTLEDENIYLVVDKIILGSIRLKEEILESNKASMEQLEKIGIRKKIMLTGDNNKQAEKVAKEYNIDIVYSSLLPAKKQEIIRKIKEEKNKVIFIGDGINDAPVLAEADFGISMGAGTEIANITSDAILMNNQLSTIPKAICEARKTMRIVSFNIAFSIVAKAVVLLLGAFGLAPMWLAVLADTGVSAVTVANAIRIIRK